MDWTIEYPDGRHAKQMAQLSLYELNVVEMMIRTGLATIDNEGGGEAGRAAGLKRIALERMIRRRGR